MNLQATAIQLRGYCDQRKLGFLSHGLTASKTGELACLRAHGVGFVEKRSIDDEVRMIDGLLGEVRKDADLDGARRRNFTDYLIAARRTLKKLGALMAQGKIELRGGERLGSFLRAKRENLGWTTTELVRKLSVPISEVAYQQIESGYVVKPPVDVMQAICGALGLDVQEAEKWASWDKDLPVLSFAGVDFRLTR